MRRFPVGGRQGWGGEALLSSVSGSSSFFFFFFLTCLVSLLWSVLTGPQIWSRILAFEELAAQREGAWQDDRRW